MLPEIEIEGQTRLLNSRVLIVGLGALGSPVSMYLAASGVGELVLMDHDQVELSNLQRQIVHASESVGVSKIRSAKRTLHALNPEISITGLDRAFTQGSLAELGPVDAVVDATDNFATRFAINRACFEANTPLVSGAAIRLEGQVSVYPFGQPDSPCYHCLYGDVAEPPGSCTQNGVLGPVAGMVGCIQAIETVKVLLGFGETLAGRLLLIDARSMDIRAVRLAKDPNCAVCGARAGAA
jgi:adenylyltransferase/sulfurtransferase